MYQLYVSMCSEGQDQGLAPRGVPTPHVGNNNAPSPVILHRKSTNHDASRIPRTSNDPQTPLAEKQRVKFGSLMDRVHPTVGCGVPRSTMVEVASAALERPIVLTDETRSRGIHGCIGHGMGHRHRRSALLGTMVGGRAATAHQPQGAPGSTEGSRITEPKGKVYQRTERQHHDHRLRQPLRRNAFERVSVLGGPDLAILPQDTDTRINNLCPLSTEPSGRAIAPADDTARMDTLSRLLPTPGPSMGSPSCGHVRVPPQHETVQLLLVGPRPSSTRHGCSTAQLETPRQSLHLSTVESPTICDSEDTRGRGLSNGRHAALAQRDLVAGAEGHVSADTGIRTTPCHPAATRPSKRPRNQPSVVDDSRARKRRRFESAGLDPTATSIVLSSDTRAR